MTVNDNKRSAVTMETAKVKDSTAHRGLLLCKVKANRSTELFRIDVNVKIDIAEPTAILIRRSFMVENFYTDHVDKVF